MPIIHGGLIYLSDQERADAVVKLRDLDIKGEDLLEQARKHRRHDLEARVTNGQRNLRDLVAKLESGEPLTVEYAESVRTYFMLSAMGERPVSN